MRALLACCLLTMAACATAPALRPSPETTPEQTLQQRLKAQQAQIASDEAARRQLRQAMQFRTLSCQRCHGADGHSRNGRCPNLAGQHPAYLLQQLQHFSDGRRRDFQMQSMVKKMRDADKIAVALYFSSLPPRPSSTEKSARTTRGAAIFQRRCAQCHGAQGEGAYGYPRLAGQLPDYLRMTLHEFRKPDSRRRDSIMRAIASLLSDAQVDALAAYIGTME